MTRDFYPALVSIVQNSYPALVSLVQNSFFPHRTLFQFMSPQRPAIWAGSRARPPVSECVSPGPPSMKPRGSKGEYVRSKELSCWLDK